MPALRRPMNSPMRSKGFTGGLLFRHRRRDRRRCQKRQCARRGRSSRRCRPKTSIFSPIRPASSSRPADGKFVDAATGAPVTPATEPDPVRQNNRVRSLVASVIGDLTLLSSDPAKRREAAATVFRSRNPAALRRSNRRSRRKPIPRSRRRSSARARPSSRHPPMRPTPIASARSRRFAPAAAIRTRPPFSRPHPPTARGRVKAAADAALAVRQLADRDVGLSPERLVRRVARIGSSARRHRPRHHLRRDGHHQHGAWRDGDARRLHDLCGAGISPHA